MPDGNRNRGTTGSVRYGNPQTVEQEELAIPGRNRGCADFNY